MSTKGLLLAVDPSLTASGWALFCIGSARPLAAGVICPPGPEHSMPERLLLLQNDVVRTLDELSLSQGDILICEGPAPLAQNPSSSLKVERVRGIFETVARERLLRVPGRVNPRTVQYELLGMKGKQLPRKEVKAWAREAALRLFGPQLAELPMHGLKSKAKQIPQDIVDALLIGSLAVSRVRLSHSTKATLESMFEPKLKPSLGGGGRRRSAWSESDIRKLQS